MALQRPILRIVKSFTSVNLNSRNIFIFTKRFSNPLQLQHYDKTVCLHPTRLSKSFIRHRTCLQPDIGKYPLFSPSDVDTENRDFCVLSDSGEDASNEVDSTKILYRKILEEFPEGIQMAFAYGSGAIEQAQVKNKADNMLDFIFVVDRPEQWHLKNMRKHSKHYSFLKRLGAEGLARIQEEYGAGVYFNTMVPMHGRIIKYGVISTARLITDLLDWETLYISGRLHKPVSLIVLPTNESLLEAMVVNLQSAVHTALLLLPDTFTEEQFYLTIAGLSYSGDVRMGIAEDVNKVRNIVQPNIWSFRRMYLPIIMGQQERVCWQDGNQLEQALTFESRHHHLSQLPCSVIQGLVHDKYEVGLFPDMDEIIIQRAFDRECGTHVMRSIKGIVNSSSAAQTFKGIFTAGFIKSIRYSFSKFSKRINSKKS